MSTENSSIPQNTYTSSNAVGENIETNIESERVSSSIPPLHPGKFDMELMRESATHWIMMHEHPFTILEEVGFNIIIRV
nr:zinc finger BED domain-containing protein RICESLEEPER 2-like [Ipomoea batatas]